MAERHPAVRATVHRTIWQLWLVSGPSQDCYSLCSQVRHAWQDGMAVAAILVSVYHGVQRSRPPCPTEHWALRSIQATDHHSENPQGPAASGSADPPRMALLGHRRVTHAATAPWLAAPMHPGLPTTVDDVRLAATLRAVRAWTSKPSRRAPVAVTVPIDLRNPQSGLAGRLTVSCGQDLAPCGGGRNIPFRHLEPYGDRHRGTQSARRIVKPLGTYCWPRAVVPRPL